MTIKNVGFIGVGNMGRPMVLNLLHASYRIKAFDIVESAMEAAVEAGAEATPSAKDAAMGVDAVVTMLPSGKHVRDVYLGEGGVIAAAAENTLLIDSSTIDV